MLLKKQVKDTKIKALYDSSNVLASTYDTSTKDLTIIFKSGNQYKYGDVSLTDYTRFETADSQGVEFNTRIKKYVSEKLGPVDVNEIINEATKIKGLEDDALELARRSQVIKSINQINLINDAVPFEKEKFTAVLTELEKHIGEYYKL